MKKLGLITLLSLLILSGCSTKEVIKEDVVSNTGIDLTNCESYFDGCNNCSVKDGKADACTLMYCETPSEPKCNKYKDEVATSTSVDLTNCESYFDGCNNCFVENGKVAGCTKMYCQTPTEPKCTKYKDGTNNGKVGMANPASVKCEQDGGQLEIVDGTGGQYGICHFADGSSCEERDYMRGECQSDSQKNPVACTMEYAPVCASVQVQCIKAPCPPIQQTYGNKCTMNANKLAKFLYEGECKTK